MSSALLIIDFQNAIFNDPPAHQADLVLARINNLISRARQAGMPVVYVQHDEADSPWEKDSATWQFPPAIAPQPGDFVSAKQHSSAFQQSRFQAALAERGITEVFVCGYATEFCIDTNVRQAAALGIKTVVIADAHTTGQRPHLDAPTIIQHHNWVWSCMGQIQVTPHEQLPF
ncbi:cysteine hydrolase family protein [Undibacterium sp. Ji50W]|uniref:cysteine hydrolase family protein n=1 Tax=Undibacterium sp. Ji50W TaxID=3413041 RepID=UPI003BF2DADB